MKCDHCSKIFENNDTIIIVERRTGIYPFQYSIEKTDLLDLIYYCDDQDCKFDRSLKGNNW